MIKAIAWSPYLFLMNKILKHNLVVLNTLALACWMHPVYANDLKNQKLLQQLTQPLAEYHLPSVKDAVNPALLNRSYQVSWIAEPQLDLTEQERRHIKTEVKLKITVVAKTGYIAKVQLLQSSNLKAVDQKIERAVMISNLEPIKGLDPNVVYVIDYTMQLK